MGFLIAGAAVGLGTAIGSAVIEHKAANKALGRQIDALNSLEYLQPDKLMKEATAADIEKYKTQLDTQQKYDPVFAGMRTQGGENILKGLQEDAGGNTVADKSLKSAQSEADANYTANRGVIDGLIAQAKQDLAAGATLPPEFQQELVRSGLEKAGQSGVALDSSGATGANTRRLLGSEGIALQQARTAEAKSNMTTAAGLQGERQSALMELATMDNNLRGAKMMRGANAAQIGSSSIPSIGLAGADKVNMDISNTNLGNDVKLSIGGLNAQKALADGKMWSSILSSTGSAVSGMLGGMGGGGGAGSMLGGLMGGGGTGGGNTASMYGNAGQALWGLLSSNRSNNGIKFSSSVPSNGMGYGPN